MEGKALFQAYRSTSQSIIKGTPGRNGSRSRGVGWGEGNAAYLHALCGLLSLPTFSNQDVLLRGGTAHSDLDSPIPTTNQENAPQVCPQANPIEGIFSIEVPSSMTPACVELLLKTSQYRRVEKDH